MSAWAILVRNLYAIGGEGTRDQFDDLPTYSASAGGLVRAQQLGLITNNGKRQRTVWRLTELGRRFCEGKAEIHKVGAPGVGRAARHVVGATWLAPLETTE